MYEEFYGFVEKPFSLTPDPKFLYKSQSHGDAYDLLQYAIRRREGFVVITGDIGTGKTTLCRAILEQIDRKTFTALVLNPFLSEEDLLALILQDFGVVSREEIKNGRLAGVTKQQLIETLYDFLLSLLPLQAGAVLIIDEAQNLPPQVLEQIRILSNLETDKEKLLQVILVGQLDLNGLLRAPVMRQLDQRVSIRHELRPLDRAEVAAYVEHRLTVAGGAASVSFTAKAIDRLHRDSGGIPRLINLLCDRALLAAYTARATEIGPEMLARAAASLDLRRPRTGFVARNLRRAALSAASLVAAAAIGATAAALTSDRRMEGPRVEPTPSRAASGAPAPVSGAPVVGGEEAVGAAGTIRIEPPPEVPAAGPYSILIGWFRSQATADPFARELEAMGFETYQRDVPEGPAGRPRQLLVGPYKDALEALTAEARLKGSATYRTARLIVSTSSPLPALR
jgi:general secretion pathway protein A